jgi:hypothetical protein
MQLLEMTVMSAMCRQIWVETAWHEARMLLSLCGETEGYQKSKASIDNNREVGVMHLWYEPGVRMSRDE